MESLLFYVFSALCIGGALGVLFVNGYVNAAMSMLCSMLGFAGLAFLEKSYLLALLIIMVYAGAVMVLFLFAIIMMGADDSRNTPPSTKLKISILWLLACALFGYFAPQAAEFYAAVPTDVITSKAMAALMFTKYALHVEVIGVLLLAAMTAVIVIARDDRKLSQKREGL